MRQDFISIRFAAALSFLLLSGCNFLSDEPEASSVVSTPFKSPQVGSAPKEEAPVNPGTESAEVVWRDNPENIDGFVIRSGPSKESLTAEVRVKKEEVETQMINSTEAHYRYILKDIPEGAALFVSIASFKGDVLSPFSAPREVPQMKHPVKAK